jgi:hypothetical protein
VLANALRNTRMRVVATNPAGYQAALHVLDSHAVTVFERNPNNLEIITAVLDGSTRTALIEAGTSFNYDTKRSLPVDLDL